VVAGLLTVPQAAQETSGRCFRRGREPHAEQERTPRFMLVVQASDLPYLPQAGRLHHNRYCWRNPPCPSFVKGGDPKAPFGKGGRAERGGFCRIAVEEKTFANSVKIADEPTFSAFLYAGPPGSRLLPLNLKLGKPA
jgi:hypothetical protein